MRYIITGLFLFSYLSSFSCYKDLEKSLSSSLQSLEASNAEIERLKLECTQLQSKYEYSQQELVQNRQELQRAREEFVGQAERFRLKELDLESELAASKRARMDIEVSDLAIVIQVMILSPKVKAGFLSWLKPVAGILDNRNLAPKPWLTSFEKTMSVSGFCNHRKIAFKCDASWKCLRIAGGQKPGKLKEFEQFSKS